MLDRPRVFLLSTTHGAETHALAAAMATMRVYRPEPVIEHLQRQGERLKRLLDSVIQRHDLAPYVEIIGKPCCLLYATRDRDMKPSQSLRTLFLQKPSARRPDAVPGRVLLAHGRGHRSHSGGCRRRARRLSHGTGAGTDKWLIGRASQPVMRAYNTLA